MYYEDAIRKIFKWFEQYFPKPNESWSYEEIKQYSYVQITCNELIDIISDHPFYDAYECIESFILQMEYYKHQIISNKGVDILNLEIGAANALLYSLKGDKN